ncbi:hypothetical protein BDP81DRAFT_396231 [Colletotrichum phormii]|uniref:Uncharacterized protein n=1 Tax=Colletotrichum phormii TaxID=359342 RepID=A0AAI9ZLL6_9PEZI|nr:uncharacterized protein BDP81DRAFT_396231 [Colletotrichum phormii]KAK1634235.1 hypothetical protein BDP81DRAFT_396231 [Colletotrichum phormii]
MFDSERLQILEHRSRWNPEKGSIGYIEAWDDGLSNNVYLKSGFLEDSEVAEWLHQTGRFVPPDWQREGTARVRLLLCERIEFRPLWFAMSRESFLQVEETLGLPSTSLAILAWAGGKQHSHLTFTQDKGVRSLESLVLTMKQPQMFQLGNLGMTGRLVKRTVEDIRITTNMNRMITDEKARINTTALLSTTLEDVVNMLRTLEWDEEYIKFLLRVNEDVRRHHGGVSSEADLELCGLIELLEAERRSIVSFTSTMRSRLDIQFNVLYNFIAQGGNNLNMQIAANAGLDSTAMKLMALVTMLFLSPTRIFSMSMFNWQVSNSSDSTGGGEPTVVPQFWIYWAVSLPLTVAIVIGWPVWWHFQKSYYETKFLRSEKENVVFEDKRHENAHGPRRRRPRQGV